MRHRVAVPDRGDGNDAPPERIGVAGKVGLPVRPEHVLLGEIHEVRAEDEPQEPDVQRGNQLLWVWRENRVDRSVWAKKVHAIFIT